MAESLILVYVIIFATLAAIIYCLRVLLLMERRVARIDTHIEALVKTVLKEELKIEAEEARIEEKLGIASKKTKKK